MENNTIESIEKYKENAVKQGKATDRGDYENANKHHDLLIASLKALRADYTDWADHLEPLVGDENEYVRCWSATHLLKEREEIAVNILTEISNGTGFCAFNAGMILDEWRNGALKLP